MTKCYWIAIIFLIIACDPYTDNVQHALEAAGDNRSEIEQVLSHFKKQGRIPYKAACFLVANVPYHKSRSEIKTEDSYKEFFQKTDSIYENIFGSMSPREILSANPKEYDSLRLELAEIFNRLPAPKQAYTDEWDITTLSADYLITNIQDALETWRTSPHLQNISFDEFKEFILPYRTTNENIMLDKPSIRAIYSKRLAGNSDNLSIATHLENYKAYVDKCRWINKHTRPKEHAGIYDLFLPKFKMDCHNMTNWSCNILRACGIPVVYEFTPQWRERPQRHFWCVSPDSTGIYLPYTAPDNNFLEDWESDIRYAGKVYRRTFGAQPDTPYFLASAQETIPDYFDTPLLSDQTWRYHQTVTLRLPLTGQIGNNVAYLCMDRQGELNPVGWGKIDHRKNEVIFEQVPLNTLFFPTCYDNDRFLPLAEPFMIQADTLLKQIPLPLSLNQPPKALDITIREGEIYHTGKKNKPVKEISYLTLTCDTSRTLTLKVERKFPEKRRLKELQEKLKGAVLLGSDNERGDFDTLYILDHAPYPYLQQIALPNPKKHRYYRLATHDRGPVNIAHLEFLGPRSARHSCTTPTPLPVFQAEDFTHEPTEKLYRINGTPLKTGSKPEVAFDGDFLTFAGSSSVGMDFGTSVEITHIRFIPRTANNGIVRQNSYALMYYDKGWKEHSLQYAQANYLQFEDVPGAILFWLRNLTEGKEEQPFFYLQDKQYFLHTDTITTNLLTSNQ